jgi:tetratricopeptide (TPR) repeat protein
MLLVSVAALLAGPARAADPTLLARGVELLEQGRLRAAEQTLREAADAEPECAEVHFALGRVLIATGRREQGLLALERARELGLESVELFAELGEAYLEDGRPDEALTVLEALGAAAGPPPEHARVRLLLGQTRLALGDVDGAAAEFEAVGDDPPGLRQIALYNLGVVRLRTGEHRAAQRALLAAAALDRETVTGRRAAALLAESSADRLFDPPKRWSLSGSAGFLYDDNVTSSEADLSTGIGDAGMAFDVASSYRLLDRPTLRLEAGYDFYQSAYFDLGEFNQQIHGIDLDASRQFGEVEAGIDYRYNLSLLGNDFLLGLHEVRPRIALAPRPGWYSVAWPRFRAKHHEDSRRSSIQGALGTDQVIVLGDGGDYALLGSSLEIEDAQGAEFDYLGFAAWAGFRKPFRFLGGDYRAGIDYRFRLRDYTSDTPSIGEKRHDMVHAGRFRLARALNELTEIRVDYDLVDSNSNLSSIHYLQNVVSLSVGFRL